MAIIESIPNVSEGRRPEVVARLADAIRATPGVRAARLLVGRRRTTDRCSRWSAMPRREERATLALFEQAVAAIDLRAHQR